MAYLSDDELLDTEGGFTGWDDETGAGATEETLEQALAEERLAELESELEQDEHPIDYEAELEDEEEEAAPVNEKRLKREIRAEAGAPGTGPRKPPWGCAAGISGGAGTQAHSPLDEQSRIPAADGRELSGHPV